MSEGNGGMPEGWVITTLGELVAPSTDKVEPANWADAPYLSLEHIEAGTRRIIGWGAGADVTSTKSRFRQGDVLYGRLRPYLNKVCIPDVDGICSTDILVLPPGKAVDNRFLLYFLSRPGVVEYATQNANGINLPRVSFDRLADLEFHLPPLPEQRRIATRIEELQARTRRAREALESVPALLEQLRQSVLASAFRGDLTADWRESHPDVEPASVLLERIRAERRRRWEAAALEKMRAKGKEPRDGRWKEKYVEPEPVDASTLPRLPEGWVWASVSEIVIDGPQNGLYLPRTAYGSGTPIVRIDDFQSDWSRASDELQRVAADATTSQTYSLQEGDVVVNRVNSPSHLGKCFTTEQRNLPALFESNMMRLRCSDHVDPHFLVGWLSSPLGRSLLTRSAKWAVNQASINQQDVTSTPIPLAPSTEQERIVASIAQIRCELSRVHSTVNGGLHSADRLDQSILARAFRGELVPQDPSDEPASVLLERIREERSGNARRIGTRGRTE